MAEDHIIKGSMKKDLTTQDKKHIILKWIENQMIVEVKENIILEQKEDILIKIGEGSGKK